MICEVVMGTDYVLPGWGCHACRSYNGAQRPACNHCGHAYCGPAYRVVEQTWGTTMTGEEVLAITKIELT